MHARCRSDRWQSDANEGARRRLKLGNVGGRVCVDAILVHGV